MTQVGAMKKSMKTEKLLSPDHPKSMFSQSTRLLICSFINSFMLAIPKHVLNIFSFSFFFFFKQKTAYEIE